MGSLQTKKIGEYHEVFKDRELTFSRDIVGATGLLAEQVQLKCGSDFWPCLLYAASFRKAKVVVNVNSGIIEKVKKGNNLVSLRLSFRSQDGKGNSLTFFMAARAAGISPYRGSSEVVVLSLQFGQRPPDDFIAIIGRVLDASLNSARMQDRKLRITPEAVKRLGLVSAEAVLFVQKVPRRCLLRDLSFAGSRLVLMGVGKFLVDREASLRVDFEEPAESFLIPGKVVSTEEIPDKQGMACIELEFAPATVPLGYKIRLNEYVNTVRADTRGRDAKTAEPK
ncbi:MAG: pilus assembly protein PilZ [Treponema sp.]|nr:pilus assembly protein PilZ [Treponema sp.]